MVRIYKCDKCGAILEIAKDGHGITCCGEPMKELTANSEDAAVEKHVPAVTVDGNTVTVKVGDVEHPMMDAHYIAHIWLESTDGVQRKDLTPSDKPEAVFALADGVKPVAAYEYCNLHGFWVKNL